MDKRLLYVGLIVAIVLVGIFLIRANQSGYNPQPTANTNSNSSGGSSTNNSSSGVPLSELSKHSTVDDCWVAYDGKVYDITSFLPNHRGGINRILPYCGTADEFQKAFTKQHGTSKVKLLMNVGVLIGDFDVMGAVQ